MSQQEDDEQKSQKETSEEAAGGVASSMDVARLLLSAGAAEANAPGSPFAAALMGSKKRQREQEPTQRRDIPTSQEALYKSRSVMTGTDDRSSQLDRLSGLDERRPGHLVSGAAGRGLLADTDFARKDGLTRGYHGGRQQRSELTEHRRLVGSGDVSQINDQVEAAIRSSFATSGRIIPVADEAESSSQRLQVLQQMVRDEERRLRIYQQQEMIIRERESLRSLEQESLRRLQLTLARDSVYARRNREADLRGILMSRDDVLSGSTLDQASLRTHRSMRDALPLPFASYEGSLPSLRNAALEANHRDERLSDILSGSKELTDRQMLPEQQTTSKNKRQGIGNSTRALALPSDKGVLSPYQSLIRESIQVFEAQSVDIDFFANSQGRNRKVELGQVGVRCQYCAHRPLHWCSRGAVYFPGSLSTIYQAAQNMAANHFLPGICEDMPDSVKEAFMAESQKKKERTVKRSAGKEYWECACRSLGLEDREGRPGVWFRQSKPNSL